MWPSAALDNHLKEFETKLLSLFRCYQGKTNLLPHQHHALSVLQSQHKFMIVPCDKILGPSIIQTKDYISIMFHDHLNDTLTYQCLSLVEANIAKMQMMNALTNWITTKPL
jgi:hypothetical protein